ncbi:SanA/YdcF family protein [Actinorugispora endophytica]|uniref:Vancomycin permeability regulator SanA n=1 Tax=Actinorugispora endophytica TaxID=1605990 RepID=A0A4V3D6G5_9ACTN|nr:ElyC/SanA/YdcF family protein [Actinorugispora endophytica]TDQ43917.1 vancomycin permeability regulator SanA [Actinorugispora endophytica]
MPEDDREERGRERAGAVRRRWYGAGLTACLVAVAGFGPVAWLHASSGDHRYEAADVPERPVAMVLGAGVTPDGEPTRLLARRLDLAAELYREGRVEAVLVTGDNSVEHYNETDAMRDYLVGAGVPDSKIAGDYAGFSTWESCVRAREVFGVEAATVITQTFHLPRAVALCRAAGLDAVGVGDPAWDERAPAMLYGHVREVPAAFKAVFDVVLRPSPTFLGPYETSVDDALADGG